jgi:hypothetical protein
MTLIISRLKNFRLYEYNTTSPIIFVEADDPDGACFKATYQLIRILLDQDSSSETKDICQDIKKDIRVLKVSTQ